MKDLLCEDCLKTWTVYSHGSQAPEELTHKRILNRCNASCSMFEHHSISSTYITHTFFPNWVDTLTMKSVFRITTSVLANISGRRLSLCFYLSCLLMWFKEALLLSFILLCCTLKLMQIIQYRICCCTRSLVATPHKEGSWYKSVDQLGPFYVKFACFPAWVFLWVLQLPSAFKICACSVNLGPTSTIELWLTRCVEDVHASHLRINDEHTSPVQPHGPQGCPFPSCYFTPPHPNNKELTHKWLRIIEYENVPVHCHQCLRPNTVQGDGSNALMAWQGVCRACWAD